MNICIINIILYDYHCKVLSIDYCIINIILYDYHCKVLSIDYEKLWSRYQGRKANSQGRYYEFDWIM